MFLSRVKFNNTIRRMSVLIDKGITIYSIRNNMSTILKNFHSGVVMSTLNAAPTFQNLLSDQRLKPISSVVRYASSEDDVVCYSELKRLKKSGKILLIDVRSKDETWRTGTMPGSLCIPFPELESALRMPSEKFEKSYCRKKPSCEDEIVFVCRRGERSFKAMKQARIMGYEKSKTYQGGFMGWFNQERINREKKTKATD